VTGTGGTGRAWIVPVLIAMVASGLSQGFGRLTFAFLLPSMVPGLVGSFSAAGTLAAVNLAAYLVSVLAMISLSSRFEATRLLRTGLIFSVAGLVAAGIAPNYEALVGSMILLGFGSGISWIACVPIVTAHAPMERRGFAFGVMHSGIGLGAVLIGLLAWFVQSFFGSDTWRPVWLIEAAIGIAILALVAVRLKPVGQQAPRVMAARGTADHAARRFPRNLWWLFVGYALFGVVHALYISFLISALQTDAGLSIGQSAQVYSVLGLLNIAGGVTLGRASDVVGRRAILVASLITMSACAIAIPSASDGVALISGATYGLLMSGFSTVVIAYIGDVLSQDQVAAKYSIITAAVGLGQMVGPPIGGALADATGTFRSTYMLASGIALVAAATVAMLKSNASRSEGTRP
jgi:MFS family permease